jgi:hypothetical protein
MSRKAGDHHELEIFTESLDGYDTALLSVISEAGSEDILRRLNCPLSVIPF